MNPPITAPTIPITMLRRHPIRSPAPVTMPASHPARPPITIHPIQESESSMTGYSDGLPMRRNTILAVILLLAAIAAAGILGVMQLQNMVP